MSRFGFTEEQFEEICGLIRANRITNQSIEAWIFGSRARGDFKPFSDVDIVISGQPAVNEKQLQELQSSFEESELPYKFDLVLADQIYPQYKTQIEKEKIRIL